MNESSGSVLHHVRRGGDSLLDDDVFAAGLSCRAIGLLALMLSKPPSWKFSCERISHEVPEGREALRSAMRELREAGFVRLEVSGGANPGSKYLVRDSLNMEWPL